MTAAVLDWPQATFASKVSIHLFNFVTGSYHSDKILDQPQLDLCHRNKTLVDYECYIHLFMLYDS